MQKYNFFMTEKRVKDITLRQLKEIKAKVQEKFICVNMKNYLVITEKATNESTSYTYDSNFVYLNFYKALKYEYLIVIGESPNYFNWRYSSLETMRLREQYLKKIIDKIIELNCGYKLNK